MTATNLNEATASVDLQTEVVLFDVTDIMAERQHESPEWAGTLAEFVEANECDDDETRQIIDALQAERAWWTGGGAAGLFVIRLASDVQAIGWPGVSL